VKLVCIVLAGGESRRMGGAKPLRPFGEGTLVSHALALARGYADDVAVAVRDAGQLSGLDAPLIVDDPAIEGPLGGLAAALAEARTRGADALLTLPCDAPRLPPDLARRLIAGLEDAPAAVVAMAASGARRHPVCALWLVSALDALPAYLATGARSLWRFAETCGVEDVEWPAEPDDPFANANTPDELAALQPPRAGSP
jgi:molybdopterin-guanine dinucleotide biosynthesis protein A